MHRLPLILCVVALLGSATSAVLFFRIGNSKQVLEQRLADSGARAAKLDTDLAAAHEQAGVLKARVALLDTDLTATRAALDTTRTQLTTADTRAQQLDRDLGQAKDVLAFYEATARALTDDVAALQRDLADSRASNASPDAVAAYKSTITELERQLATARNGAAAPATAGASTAVFASRAGRATVLTVGPGNAFVVLNFGEARGAKLGHKLTISQGTNTVATVQISDLRTNFSVAQVLPETLRGVLQKGDSAVLIRTP
ncbi:MAG: hypothetical protein Q8N18_02320 [Opitutaceae bacterium]|nr:hypothetical protein [Opitutaceae bacterium]